MKNITLSASVALARCSMPPMHKPIKIPWRVHRNAGGFLYEAIETAPKTTCPLRRSFRASDKTIVADPVAPSYAVVRGRGGRFERQQNGCANGNEAASRASRLSSC